MANQSLTKGRVLILSGDVHFSELTSYPKNQDPPDLVELTSTPFLLKDAEYFGNDPRPPQATAQEENENRIFALQGEGFARIQVEFINSDRNKPKITMEWYNANGTIQKTGQIISDIARVVDARAIWHEDGGLTYGFLNEH